MDLYIKIDNKFIRIFAVTDFNRELGKNRNYILQLCKNKKIDFIRIGNIIKRETKDLMTDLFYETPKEIDEYYQSL